MHLQPHQLVPRLVAKLELLQNEDAFKARDWKTRSGDETSCSGS